MKSSVDLINAELVTKMENSVPMFVPPLIGISGFGVAVGIGVAVGVTRAMVEQNWGSRAQASSASDLAASEFWSWL